MARLYAALAHYPVLNRKGEIIASAVTNLDLHDMARSCCTYGMPACYIVTPLKDQRTLVKSLLDHWIEGVGRLVSPDRGEALRRLRIVESVADAIADIEVECGGAPIVWATTAHKTEGSLAHREARRVLAEESRPCLLLFGTAWGLAPSVIVAADAVLDPVRGLNGYNHLSVRCAAAILIDRLLHTER